MRDGTVRIVTMGRRIVGKWKVKSGQLCIGAPMPEDSRCKEVWRSGDKINSGSRGTQFPTMSFSKSSNSADGDNPTDRFLKLVEVPMSQKLPWGAALRSAPWQQSSMHAPCGCVRVERSHQRR